jgi:hypothetical protein
VPVLAHDMSDPVRTKIEFSSHNGEQRYMLETQVLPFLDPEIADLYDETSWQQMQSLVVDALLAEDR